MNEQEMKLTLAEHDVAVISEAKNEGWIIKIIRKNKTVVLSKVYKDKKLLDRAIFNAICYEFNKI